jgi:hypothetical protein
MYSIVVYPFHVGIEKRSELSVAFLMACFWLGILSNIRERRRYSH